MMRLGQWKELVVVLSTGLLASCSVSQQIDRQAQTYLFSDAAIQTGHIGISIYDADNNKYLYNHQANQYFTPASNTKFFTLYAGLSILGDSLDGLRYTVSKDTVYAIATGDPTLRHSLFSQQPVIDFFTSNALPVVWITPSFQTTPYGKGWSWDDYNEAFVSERNALPIYGNVTKIEAIGSAIQATPSIPNGIYQTISNATSNRVERNRNENVFSVYLQKKTDSIEKEVPFVTNGNQTAMAILHKEFPTILPIEQNKNISTSHCTTIHSQSTDSVFSIMMHRSDNFFAEQTILMASNKKLGYMDESVLIDTLLQHNLKDLPQPVKWVDGSGLSRYNLFTPQSFIYILDKLNTEFGMQRMKSILPTGGEGTLKYYYSDIPGYIFAKTGTLSNNSSLCGYLYTKKGKLFLFSILSNNYLSNATPVRKAFERFLISIRERY